MVFTRSKSAPPPLHHEYNSYLARIHMLNIACRIEKDHSIQKECEGYDEYRRGALRSLISCQWVRWHGKVKKKLNK